MILLRFAHLLLIVTFLGIGKYVSGGHTLQQRRYASELDLVIQTTCSKGEYLNSTTSICTDCPAGKYTDVPNSEATCTLCAAGLQPCTIPDNDDFPCEPGADSEYAACIFCSPGSSSQPGEACKECPAGKFSLNDNEGYPRCYDCTVGRYSNDTGTIGSCTLCPEGRSSKKNSTTESACKGCTPGLFGTTGAAERTCNPCQPGKFSNTTEALFCYDCPAGFYQQFPSQPGCERCPATSNPTSVIGARSKLQACFPLPNSTDCGEGAYYNMHSLECEYCEHGTYQPLNGTGITSCEKCPAGTFSDILGSTDLADCSPCGNGTYSSVAGFPCQLCKAGRSTAGADFLHNITQTDTTSKPDIALRRHLRSAGRYTQASWPDISTFIQYNGYTTCVDCRLGFYIGGVGAAACEKCNDGMTTTLRGAITAVQCVDCTVGHFELDGLCKICDPGYFAAVNGTFGQCTPCPIGRYQNSNASSSCIDCPPEYIARPDAPAGADSLQAACILPTPSPTATITTTPTATATTTTTSTVSSTTTCSATASSTASATMTHTSTATSTTTLTSTATTSITATPTTTPTSTASSMVSSTATLSATPSATATATSTATSSATASSTATATSTTTSTYTSTVTASATSSATATATNTATSTTSSTATSTATPTSTATSTSSSTATLSATASASSSSGMAPAVLPESHPSGFGAWWNWVLIAAGTIFLLGICLFFIVRKRRKNKAREEKLDKRRSVGTSVSNPTHRNDNEDGVELTQLGQMPLRSMIMSPSHEKKDFNPNQLGEGFSNPAGRNKREFDGDKKGFAPIVSRNVQGVPSAHDHTQNQRHTTKKKRATFAAQTIQPKERPKRNAFRRMVGALTGASNTDTSKRDSTRLVTNFLREGKVQESTNKM